MSAGEWFESLSDLGAGTFGRRGIPNMSCGVAVHGYELLLPADCVLPWCLERI